MIKQPLIRSLAGPRFLNHEFQKRIQHLSTIVMSLMLVMIYGPRGCGKSYLALSFAIAMASGKPIFGWKPYRPRSVLYLDGEMAGIEFQGRLRRLAASFQLRTLPSNLRLVTPELQRGMLPDLSTKDGQEQIDALIENSKAQVVFIDNLSAWMHSSREDADSWLPVAHWAMRHRLRGRTIIFIHHAGKSGGQRGTSKREDLLDVVMSLVPPPAHKPSDGVVFDLRFTKVRHLAGRAADPFRARMISRDGIIQWKKEPLDALSEADKKIVMLTKQRVSMTDIAKNLGVDKATISRRVKALRAASKLE